VIDAFVSFSRVYRLWQLPFVGQKFAPVARAVPLASVRSVLDIGCGPGTNARYFRDVGYVGVDISERYVAAARRRFGDRFVAGDATESLPDSGAPYDFILANSLLHHLDDAQVESVLSRAASLLAPNGAIHILDHEIPTEPGIARFLTLHDRGNFMRPRDEWRSLLGNTLSITPFEFFPLRGAGRTLWTMFYCRGTPL
jgi:SAM-dependent methyltransferase